MNPNSHHPAADVQIVQQLTLSNGFPGLVALEDSPIAYPPPKLKSLITIRFWLYMLNNQWRYLKICSTFQLDFSFKMSTDKYIKSAAKYSSGRYWQYCTLAHTDPHLHALAKSLIENLLSVKLQYKHKIWSVISGLRSWEDWHLDLSSQQ